VERQSEPILKTREASVNKVNPLVSVYDPTYNYFTEEYKSNATPKTVQGRAEVKKLIEVVNLGMQHSDIELKKLNKIISTLCEQTKGLLDCMEGIAGRVEKMEEELKD